MKRIWSEEERNGLDRWVRELNPRILEMIGEVCRLGLFKHKFHKLHFLLENANNYRTGSCWMHFQTKIAMGKITNERSTMHWASRWKWWLEELKKQTSQELGPEGAKQLRYILSMTPNSGYFFQKASARLGRLVPATSENVKRFGHSKNVVFGNGDEL